MCDLNLLFVSETGLTLGLAMRCESEGHNVRYLTQGTSGQGLVKLFNNEQWAPDLTIYDSNDMAQEADSARANGYKALGPSRWSSMVELDDTYRNQIINAVGWPSNHVPTGTHFYISAWFNGNEFISTYTSILYRRFMPGGAGPDLSCTGMLGCFNGLTDKTFDTFVRPLDKVLKKVNHRGCVHIHALVDGDSFCVKEVFTSFAHPLSLLLYENTSLSSSEVILRLLDETSKPIRTNDPWACGLQVSLPPYPHQTSDNLSAEILGIMPANLKHLWLADISFTSNRYYVAGRGLVGYVTARGKDENECVRRMYRTVGNLKAPDLQYRNDVGRHTQSLLASLTKPGWID